MGLLEEREAIVVSPPVSLKLAHKNFISSAKHDGLE